MDAYENYTYSNSSGMMPYRMLRPQNPDPSKKYPLVIMLHGKGEGIGQECTNQEGLNRCNILWGGKMHLDSLNKYPGYVVFPQTGGGDWTSDQPVNLLKGLIEYLLKNNKIDLDRIYIHGLSAGGVGVWQFVYRYPALFAAMSPMSASGDPSQVQRVLYTPIWTIQGGSDTQVRPQVSIVMMDAMRNAGNNPYMTFDETTQRQKFPKVSENGVRPIYMLIPKGGHVVWPNLYNTSGWLQWMYAQNKHKIQVVGRTVISPGETTKLGISPGFDAYEWSNGARSNQIVVSKAGTYRVRYLRKAYYFSGPQEWSAWSDPVTITASPAQGPAADAGRDLLVELPTNYTTIRGYASGSHLSYKWEKIQGPDISFGSANTSTLYLTGMKAGTYTFRMTVTDRNGRTAYDDANVIVYDPSAPQSVKSLVLVNADNGTDIRELKNGDVISLSSLPKNINIRINTYPAFVGSVKTTLDGVAKIDNNPTYTYFGENDNKYFPGKLTAGTHTLTAVPYTNYNAAGTAGTGLSVTFTVSGSTAKIAAAPVSFMLVNGNNQEDIREIKDGDVINIGELPIRNLNIRAAVNDGDVNKVVFTYDGKVSESESAPFNLFNGKSFSSVGKGKHSLHAAVFNNIDGHVLKEGEVGINFEIVESLPETKAQGEEDSLKVTLYPNPLEGESIHLEFGVKHFDIHVSIYDQMGNLIRSSEVFIPGDSRGTQIDMHGLHTGIYKLRITSDKLRNKIITVVKK